MAVSRTSTSRRDARRLVADDSAALAIPFRRELSRKAIHLASAIIPIGYATRLVSQRELLAVLGTATVIALLIEGARRRWSSARSGFDALFGGMLRSHERDVSSGYVGFVGATWMLLAYTIVAFVAPAPVAIAAMCAVSLGDAFAALVGRTLGTRRVGVGGKSLEGSVACAVVSTIAAHVVAGFGWPAAVIIGLAASFAEFPSRPLDDNMRVAGITACVAAATVLVWGMPVSSVLTELLGSPI